ncbi:MAG: hypothetical protein NT138_26015, partial [Planctomycetales bacterium]|nr:hypothetical protein [Planctomycetales bacterium]
IPQQCVYSSVASLCFRKLFVDINFYAAMALSFEPVMNNPGLTASRRRLLLLAPTPPACR